MAFGSGEADFRDSRFITVASGNAQQQAGSIEMASSITIKRRVIIPQRSKGIPEDLFDKAMTNQESNAAIRSNDMCNSTTREVTRKRNTEDSSFTSRKKVKRITESFEGRCKQLIDFKGKFGHCNIPQKYSVNPSLGKWCDTMRYIYNKIKQGPKPERNLTQDQIERLEEIGFKWKLANKTKFEQRCHDLEAFKSEFGHSNVPFRSSAHPALGRWCSAIRCAYNQLQQGQKPKRALSFHPRSCRAFGKDWFQVENHFELMSRRSLKSNTVMILKNSRASLGTAMFPVSTQ